jgi:hypothetical protein
MTVRRVWRGIFTALALAICILGAVRGTIWALGASLAGPSLLAGPYVTVWDTPDIAFDENFGGLSGLLVEGDSLIAASDRGALFVACVQRGDDGWLDVPTDARMIILPLLRGWPTQEAETDLEGLARMGNGDIVLAFERFARIDTLKALDATPRPSHRWNLFEDNFGNRAFEAVATLPDGDVLAILEGPSGAPATFAHRWDGVRGGDGWSERTEMPLSDGFVIVGADMGPDGCLYLLDRKFTLMGGFAHRLRRVARLDDLGEVIYTSAPAVLGNAEGISISELENGDLIATLITDNNFVPLPPTQLIEYRLKPSVTCDGLFDS